MHVDQGEAGLVSVLVVATGPYLDFAMRLLPDISRYVNPSGRVEVHLFTDGVPADQLGRSNMNTIVHRVPNYRWPEASLLRYEMFHAVGDRIRGEVAMYMDADMEVVAPVGPELHPNEWERGIALVAHPGFYRKPFRRGTWETNRHSKAYVELWRRKRYVCGGVWMGRRPQLLTMCAELAKRVELDSRNGIVARWHDESHLNWFAAQRRVTVLSPEYCYVPKWPHQMCGLTPRIRCIEKEGLIIREASPLGLQVRSNHTRPTANGDI